MTQSEFIQLKEHVIFLQNTVDTLVKAQKELVAMIAEDHKRIKALEKSTPYKP